MRKSKKKVVTAKPRIFITSEFDDAKKSAAKFVKEMKTAERLLNKHRTLLECIAALRPGFKLFVLNTFGALRIVIGCRVQKMAEIQPVLELLEKHLHITFDETSDEAELKWRSFTSSGLKWLRVDAEVADDSVACKQVIVGYEQTPKYELQCEDN